jgi:hypothetical protein
VALIRIRATTFNLQLPTGPRLGPSMWEREIRRQVDAANVIYGPHYITFEISNFNHLHNAASE